MMVGVTNIIARRILINRSESFMTSILSQNANNLNLHIGAVIKVTDSLYNDIDLTYNDNHTSGYMPLYLDRIESLVKIAAELSPSKSAYVVFSESESDYVWYSDHNFTGSPERDYPLNEVNEITDHVIVEPIWITSNDNQVISYRRPVIRNNETVAVTGSNLNFTLIQSQLNLVKYLSSGYLYLVDNMGQVVYHPQRTTDPIDLDLMNENGLIETSESVSALYELDNGLYLALTIDIEEIYDGLNLLATVTASLILLSVIVVIVYSVYVSKVIGEPYVYLANQVDAVGHGDYDVTFNELYFNRGDEVGVLTRALVTMIEKQKESFDKIQNYNLNLENLIAERTEELQESNALLEESVEEVQAQKSSLEDTNLKLRLSLEEIEKTRKQLIESEKLVSTRYLAIGIAHNLNTPIGNILAITSYLESKVNEIEEKVESNKLSKGDLNEYIRQYKEAIHNISLSIDASKALIDRLLDLSMINTTDYQTDFNVIDTIMRQYEVRKSDSSIKNAKLEIKYGEDISFRGNYDAFNQLISELIDNSFVHRQDTDLLIISVGFYKSPDEDKCFILEYEDNGPGVSDEKIEEIYTPLFTSQLSQRHGLGLSMVFNLVTQQFKGKIDVNSEKGLKFRIKLYE
jgi:signal transduction histidine kinase